MHKLLTLGLASLFLVVTGCQDTNTTGTLDGPTGPLAGPTGPLAGPSFHEGGDNGDDGEQNGGDEQSFRWLAGTGMTQLGFLCNLGGPPCPNAAMASNGETIEISGEGTLSIDAEDGDPEDVTGGGSFRHIDAGGAVIATGTWTAEELISFASFGPSAGFPPTWEAGKALIEVELVSDVGGMEFDAVLRVGCILDPTNPDLPAGTIEGVRLDVEDLLNFDQDLERSTLFIRLAG